MLNNNDEILAALERVVAEIKRKKRENIKVRDTTRNKEIKKLRLEEGWTLQRIGDKYNITRERVRQIVGNTGYISTPRTEERNNFIKSQTEKTNNELSEELGISYQYISQIRGNTRHAIEKGNKSLTTGVEWEEWAHEYLLKNKIENELQPIRSPYDIIALGNVFIDVKVATKPCETGKGLISPQYHFHPNINHNKADIYMLIIAPLEDVFIIPAKLIENMDSVYFCWPTTRPEIGKLQKYYNRLDIIRKVHEQKAQT